MINLNNRANIDSVVTEEWRDAPTGKTGREKCSEAELGRQPANETDTPSECETVHT